MNSNWAATNLQTIRTLMERSAVYRRALAPVTLFTGAVGLAAGGVGWMTECNSPRRFVVFWFAVAVAALAGSFVIVRRQALRDQEPFWSPPTRRVAQAMLPCFYIGLIAGLANMDNGDMNDSGNTGILLLIAVWMALYGAALNAAGFLIPRGIKLLGWLFILLGTALLLRWHIYPQPPEFYSARIPHLLMALTFGGLHLAYGIYLHFTEKKSDA